MKKKLITAALMLGLSPVVALAGHRGDQCALDSTCSFTLQGKFNKVFYISGFKPGEKYVCNIISGDGHLLSVTRVTASKGIIYTFKGRRLNKPFIIETSKKLKTKKGNGGVIQYTLHNHNDPWQFDSFQLKCKMDKTHKKSLF